MESAAATKPRLWGWLALICVLLFVAAVRIRLRDMPLERDEGEFAYGGQLLLQGVPPGRLLYTLKLPGTHAAYAALMFLFGQSNAGVHLGFLLVNAATIVLLFLLARVLLGNVAASIAAATFGLLSLSPGVLGTSAHATHFVVLMAVAGLWWLWRAANTGRRLAYLGAGAMLGASVLMKHNGLMFVALALGWLVALGYTKQFAPSPPLGKALLFFATGVATPLLLFGVLLWWAGTWENCWFWSVKYAQAYAKPNPSFTLTWLNLMQRMPAVLVIPFYFAVTGAVVLWLRRESRSVALFATRITDAFDGRGQELFVAAILLFAVVMLLRLARSGAYSHRLEHSFFEIVLREVALAVLGGAVRFLDGQHTFEPVREEHRLAPRIDGHLGDAAFARVVARDLGAA